MKENPALIAGGGIAGLACALALAPRPVIVLERAEAFEEVGAGLQLGPNAVRALRALGAWDAVAPITSSPPALDIHDGLTGKMLKHLNLGLEFEQRFGAPYRVAHRADLHRALLDCVKANPHIEIHTGSEVTGFSGSAHEVSVELASGKSMRGSLLIGCDGVHSRLRQSAFPATAPIDSGLVLHRAMTTVPRDIAGIDFDNVNLWLCPGSHVVHYPVGKFQRLNLVATTATSTHPHAAHHQSCRTLQDILQDAENWLPWQGLFVPPLPNWRHEGLLLLGDAAHGTLPFLAQGAAMALEDAAHLHGRKWDADQLANFMAIRQRRTGRLHRATLQAGRRYHARGFERLIRNAALTMISDSAFWQRLDWLYKA